MSLLGAHVSVAGGLELAFERGERLGCRAIQIFVKNPNQWKHPALATERVEAFRRERARSELESVVAHASYLVNLGAKDRSTLGKSRRALVDELSRCNRLGVDGLIFHPGAHMGRGEEAGLARISDSMNRVLAAYVEREGRHGRTARTRLLLENTAGQGTVLGYRFGQLGQIVDRLELRPLVGLCLDTCHAFAAGYPLDRPRGLGSTLSRRHANLGEGEIGEPFFGRLARHRRLRRTPMILETPLGEDRSGHIRDLALLRALS
jgi:deoxyribonuclease-4